MEDPDGDGEGVTAAAPSLIDPIAVINYIKRTIPVLMEEDPSDITPHFEVYNTVF